MTLALDTLAAKFMVPMKIKQCLPETLFLTTSNSPAPETVSLAFLVADGLMGVAVPAAIRRGK